MTDATSTAPSLFLLPVALLLPEVDAIVFFFFCAFLL